MPRILIKGLLTWLLFSFLAPLASGPLLACPEAATETLQVDQHADCIGMDTKSADHSQKSPKIAYSNSCCLTLSLSEIGPAVYIAESVSGRLSFRSDKEPRSNIPESLYKPPDFM